MIRCYHITEPITLPGTGVYVIGLYLLRLREQKLSTGAEYKVPPADLAQRVIMHQEGEAIPAIVASC